MPSFPRLLVGTVIGKDGERLGKSDEIAAPHRPYLGLPVRAQHGETARDERLHPLVVEDETVLGLHDGRAHGAGEDLPALPEGQPVRGVVNEHPLKGVGEELPPAVGGEIGSEHERVRDHGGKAVPSDDRVAFVEAELRIKQG